MRRAMPGILAAVIAILAVALAMPSVDALPEDAEARKKAGKRGGKKPKKKRRHRRVGSRLASFGSCDSVIEFGDAQARRIGEPGYPPSSVPPYPPPLDPTQPGPAPVSAAVKKEAQPFSQTNVQEQDVDEPDIVKTNGESIFAIGGNSLYAVDGQAPQAPILSSLKLEGFSHELLLVGSRVLVISQKEAIPESIEPPPLPDPPDPPKEPVTEEDHAFAKTVTLLSEVDVSNPAAMQVVRTQEVDGRYVSSRLTGDQARVVISTQPAATIAPQSALRTAIGGWVPSFEFKDLLTGESTTAPLLSECPEVERPLNFSGLDMLSVLTIDLTKGLPAVDADGVMSDGRIVYASAKGLYVATERWRGIKPVEDPSMAETGIHRFDISQPGATEYKSSGVVRGQLLNQFSMSEYNGFLRVASTGDAIGSGDYSGNESFVSVLKQEGKLLARVGRVGNLGLGERIYAVRMIGDKGYVVTFRQVDPLYTLDLSAPANPRVVGELKILGYSAYLHPITSDLLLGVGANSTAKGSRIGAQLSVFDVSNPKEPKRTAHWTIGGRARTSVEDTHRAFLYWPASRLAVIPIDARARRRGGFVGAMGFRIRPEKIRRVGQPIIHEGIPFDEIQRTLVIGGRLFTLSCTGIESAGLAALRQRSWTPFDDPNICIPPPENFD